MSHGSGQSLQFFLNVFIFFKENCEGTWEVFIIEINQNSLFMTWN